MPFYKYICLSISLPFATKCVFFLIFNRNLLVNSSVFISCGLQERTRQNKIRQNVTPKHTPIAGPEIASCLLGVCLWSAWSAIGFLGFSSRVSFYTRSERKQANFFYHIYAQPFVHLTHFVNSHVHVFNVYFNRLK